MRGAGAPRPQGEQQSIDSCSPITPHPSLLTPHSLLVTHILANPTLFPYFLSPCYNIFTINEMQGNPGACVAPATHLLFMRGAGAPRPQGEQQSTDYRSLITVH